MAKRYLFDTGVYSAEFSGGLPTKWERYWKDVRSSRRKLILFEPLIAEIIYRTARSGVKNAKQQVTDVKGLSAVDVVPLGDVEAFDAGALRLQHTKLSLVDCLLISVAKRHSAKIVTTDSEVKEVARSLGVESDFLPAGMVAGASWGS